MTRPTFADGGVTPIIFRGPGSGEFHLLGVSRDVGVGNTLDLITGAGRAWGVVTPLSIKTIVKKDSITRVEQCTRKAIKNSGILNKT